MPFYQLNAVYHHKVSETIGPPDGGETRRALRVEAVEATSEEPFGVAERLRRRIFWCIRDRIAHCGSFVFNLFWDHPLIGGGQFVLLVSAVAVSEAAVVSARRRWFIGSPTSRCFFSTTFRLVRAFFAVFCGGIPGGVPFVFKHIQVPVAKFEPFVGCDRARPPGLPGGRRRRGSVPLFSTTFRRLLLNFSVFRRRSGRGGAGSCNEWDSGSCLALSVRPYSFGRTAVLAVEIEKGVCLWWRQTPYTFTLAWRSREFGGAAEVRVDSKGVILVIGLNWVVDPKTTESDCRISGRTGHLAEFLPMLRSGGCRVGAFPDGRPPCAQTIERRSE